MYTYSTRSAERFFWYILIDAIAAFQINCLHSTSKLSVRYVQVVTCHSARVTCHWSHCRLGSLILLWLEWCACTETACLRNLLRCRGRNTNTLLPIPLPYKAMALSSLTVTKVPMTHQGGPGRQRQSLSGTQPTVRYVSILDCRIRGSNFACGVLSDIYTCI